MYGQVPLWRLSRESREALAKARRPRRRPHEAHTLQMVRHLVEETTLSYRTIAERTRTSAATVSRHAKAGAWVRPQTGTLEEHYSPEGRRRLRRLQLAETVLRRAEHLLFQHEMNPSATPAGLRRVTQLIKLSKNLDEMDRPKRRKRKKRPREAQG